MRAGVQRCKCNGSGGESGIMNEFVHAVRQFYRDTRGLETVEYALMTALIVIGAAGAIAILVVAIGNRFAEAAATIGL